MSMTEKELDDLMNRISENISSRKSASLAVAPPPVPQEELVGLKGIPIATLCQYKDIVLAVVEAIPAAFVVKPLMEHWFQKKCGS